MKIGSFLLFIVFLPAFLLAQNHLQISEVQVAPDSNGFIEIFNPNPFPVSLDDYYLSDYNTYYTMVNQIYTSQTADFLVKFPAGTSIDSAGVLVIALDGSGFTYGTPDFEIKGTSTQVADMDPLYVGSSAKLSKKEMVMLFHWDGQSDLVEDVDYVMWGDYPATFVDKSGVSIDGPDPDSTPSTYLNDTPVTAQEAFYPAPLSGSSMERNTVMENGEVLLGGNGISGHDETSESIAQNFSLQTSPTPGSTTLEIPTGSGSGVAYVFPDSVRTDTTLTLTFVIKGNIADTLTTVSLAIPASWSWSGSTGDVQLSGPAFAGASVSVAGNDITLTGTMVTIPDSGVIAISNLTSPSQPEESLFEMQTAVSGSAPKPISESPRVVVWQPPTILSIAQVQGNPSLVGQPVTIEGIVVLGAGITTTVWTDAYVQDTSRAGINIYRSNEIDTNLVRGYRVRITGTVDEYGGVTEIVDYTVQVISKNNPLPDPVKITTQQANDLNLEGTFVEISGTVTDMYSAGGGTNILVSDGSGDCNVRVWDSANLDLTGVDVGVNLVVRGPIDIYQSNTQILLGYQEDLTIVTLQPGDGSGTATVSPDSVGTGESGISLEFTIVGEAPYTLETISLNIPSDWQWSQSASDVQLSGAGFGGASAAVQGNYIEISSAAVTSAAEGIITISNLTSPANDTYSTFPVKTATAGGVLAPIANSPRVKVGEGIAATAISDIQLNTSQYLGQQVTILGVVVVGAGITTTGWTDAYVQDNSGYGINVYQSGTIDPLLKRGNLIAITGTVEEYQGVTEITNYTLEVIQENAPLPQPLILTTNEANDLQWEGTFIQVEGEITDKYSAGGGTNISVDDGTGACTLRIWDSANLNLTSFEVGDTIIARGPMDIYQGSAQLLIAYQEDIYEPGGGVLGDGSGFATITPDSLPPDSAGVSVALRLWSTPTDTVRTVRIRVPVKWGWSANPDDISLGGSGFQNSTKKVIMEYDEFWIELGNCFLTGTDSGTVTIGNFTTASDSAYSYFWVKTAVEGGVPQFIAASPRVAVGSNPIYRIRDIQTNSAQFTDIVTLRGVVTVGSGVLRTDRTSAYMQDVSGRGININKSGTPDPNFRRGFKVQITGTVSEYREVTQVTPETAVILDSSAVLPEPIDLTTGEANDPRWDGTLLRVHGVVVEKYTTSSQPPYDYNIVINDGTGPLTLRVWGTTGINLDSIDVNKAVIASGVGSVYIDRDGKPNYQILPAYQEDIVIDPTYQPSLEGVSLDVPPNPFVPDRGEKIKIRYNAGAVNNRVTLRIFDTAGRLVTTLLDEDAQLIVNTFAWDGRDRYGDFVPLGTYICHLEVIEPVTGKKRTRLAPIVVGTILKK